MACLVKFQFSIFNLVLSILTNSFSVGELTSDSLLGEGNFKILGAHGKEKSASKGIPPVTSNTKKSWSPQRLTLVSMPMSHLFRKDIEQPVFCTSDQFVCAHGLKCISNSERCDGTDDCGDGSRQGPHLP